MSDDSQLPSAGEIEATLLEAAAAAAALTLPKFRQGIAVDNKWATGFDPVTAADREAELAVREVIGRRYPEHAIVGEEWDNKDTGSRFAWIVDPIDGTRAFITGVPVWGTLIGFMVDGHATAGLMAQPFTGELWFAANGRGEYHRNGEIIALRTSPVVELAHAKMTTTSPDLFVRPGRDLSRPWNAITEAVLTVRYGLDCYGYCLLASGHIDLVVEPGLKDVDICPLIPVIEAAGGVITTWDGGPAEGGGNCVAAANAELHAKALAVINGALR
jgi:histidinol phosphatase-like enzyme (inositol monophosphatase family)